MNLKSLARGVLEGKRAALGRAITLVESQLPQHRQQAQALLTQLQSPALKPRIGFTGPPGAGKSSLIESLGMFLLNQHPQARLAVLAVDPSSQISGGSLLGDKTRMEELARHPRAYIRPSPNGRTLGGVALRTLDVIRLCEAAGFDYVFVETVGVGQAETVVSQLVDTVVLVALPGAGDDLQGIKRGIMESADLVAVNKADGERKKLAARALAHFHAALKLLPSRTPGWDPPVMLVSALEQTGLSELLEALERHFQFLLDSSEDWRAHQAGYWFEKAVEETIFQRFFSDGDHRRLYDQLREQVSSGAVPLEEALEQLFSDPQAP